MPLGVEVMMPLTVVGLTWALAFPFDTRPWHTLLPLCDCVQLCLLFKQLQEIKICMEMDKVKDQVSWEFVNHQSGKKWTFPLSFWFLSFQSLGTCSDLATQPNQTKPKGKLSFIFYFFCNNLMSFSIRTTWHTGPLNELLYCIPNYFFL